MCEHLATSPCVRKIRLLFSKKPQQPECRIARLCVHTYPSQIVCYLRLPSNLLHGLGEHPNVPSCSEEDLGFLFPDGRAAPTPTRKCKHFYGWVLLFHCLAKKPLIHFKLAAYRLNVWTSKCIIMKGGGLGISLSRWHKNASISGWGITDRQQTTYIWMFT